MALDKKIIEFIVKNKKNKGTYIETGFKYGDSVESIKNIGFNKIISIELHPDFVEKGKKRFEEEIKQNKIEIIEGNSETTLPKVLKRTSDISVIFLDAHHYERTKNVNAPLEKEINHIKNICNNNIMLIIDDFYLIKKNYKHPTLPLNAPDWRKEHDVNNLIKILKDFYNTSGRVIEFPYLLGALIPGYDYHLNSYLVAGPIEKLNVFFISNVYLKFIIKLIIYKIYKSIIFLLRFILPKKLFHIIKNNKKKFFTGTSPFSNLFY